jgi:hypothetical protein
MMLNPARSSPIDIKVIGYDAFLIPRGGRLHLMN